MGNSERFVQLDLLAQLQRIKAPAVIREARHTLRLSRPEFARLLGVSVRTIERYEHGEGIPPPVFLLDLIDAAPTCNLRFNEIASTCGYQPTTSKDPAAYPSLHAFVAGIRTIADRNRAEFAATLDVTPAQVASFEHQIKPDLAFLQRLARRYLRPDYTFAAVVDRFRFLRPTDQDTVIRSNFARLRDPATGDRERAAIREEIIRDHVDVAKRFATRAARRYRYPDAKDAWTEALVKAVDRHDAAYGDFVPYLRAYVRGAVRQEVSSSHQSGIRQVFGSCGSRIISIRETLTHRLGRAPSIQEIADYSRLPVPKISEILRALAETNPASLDAQTYDRIPNQRTFQTATLPDHLVALLDQLDESSRRVIRLSIVEGLTLDQVATALSLTSAHAEKLVERATQQLRAIAAQSRGTVTPLRRARTSDAMSQAEPQDAVVG